MICKEQEAANTRVKVQPSQFLEVVDPNRPGDSRIPVQRTVIGSGGMDEARIPRWRSVETSCTLCRR